MEAQQVQPANTQVNDGRLANIVYILYLAGLVAFITGIIGVVMAYVNRKDAPEWVQTHYQFQIRTFWIGVPFFLLFIVSNFILLGPLVYLAWFLWLIIRCAKGMKYVNRGQPHPNPTTWLF